MKRSECEQAIAQKLKEIRDIYVQYRGEPKDVYLSMCIHGYYMTCNNERWPGGKDEHMPIDYTEWLTPTDTKEYEVLKKWAQDNNYKETQYQISVISVENLIVGDVITIQPACYDDLPLCAYEVESPIVPFEEEKNSWVVCGFVFDADTEVVVLRRK